MITGLLEERPLPAVLHQLYALRFTGELALNARASLIQIYLRDGYPVYVNLSESSDLLGRILVEMKILTEAAMRRSLATPPEPGQRYGDVLLSLALCDENQLRQALRAQVRRKLHRLFALTEGGYAAIPGEHQKGLQGGESMRVHPWRVIYHGVRSYPPDRLRTLLRPLAGQALRLHPQAAPDAARRYGFAAEENHIQEILRRGYWSLHELLEAAGLDHALTLGVVYTLWLTEQLELGPEGSHPQGRDHIIDLPPLPRRMEVVELPLQPKAEPVTPRPEPRQPAEPARAQPPRPEPATPRPPAKPSAHSPLPELELDRAPEPKASGAQEPVLKLELDHGPKDEAAREPPKKAEPAGEAPADGARPASKAPAKAASGGSPKPPPGASQTNLPAVGRPGAPAPRAQGRPVSFEEMALLRAEIENKAKVIDDESLFAVLGVDESADAAAVKAAFLQAAKKYHPDRVVAMGLQALKEQADKIFRRVNEAYSVLTDAERREEYIAELRLKDASGDRALKEKELAVKAVNAELAFSRGTVFLRKRDYASAVREFEEAVRLNPDEGEHVGYAAWTRFCAGKANAAESTKEIVRAVRMAPKCGRLHYFLGVLYKQEGNEDKAYQSFKKAHELDNRIDEALSEIRLIEMRRSKRTGGKPSGESQKGDKPAERKWSFLDRLRQPIGKK